jgi:hypothetical protein
MARQEINLFIVENKDGRNEQFLPLFSAMNNSGFGKFVDKQYYIIASNMNANQNSKVTTTFALIQQAAMLKGFNHVMYCL